MTKKQRAQVVELLRCAADLWITNRGWILTAARDLDVSNQIRDDAWDAFKSATPGLLDFDHVLEAAARVEEGSWP